MVRFWYTQSKPEWSGSRDFLNWGHITKLTPPKNFRKISKGIFKKRNITGILAVNEKTIYNCKI